MNWSKIEYKPVKLSEVCEILGGGTPSRNIDEYFNGTILWVTPTEVSKNRIEKLVDTKEKITKSGLENSSARLLPIGTVLMTSRASIGNIAIADIECTTNQGFINFVCSKSINNFFLAYWLFCNKNVFENAANGATFKEISRGSIKQFSIPLPSLEVQQQIAALLDRADTLRQLDRQLLTHYDTLIQSVFLDMFGDPVKNEKGWEVKKLGDILDFMTSGSRGWAEYYSNSGSLFLRIQNVGYNRLKMNEIAFVNPPNTAEAKRTKVCEGDILLSITADLGRTAVIPKNFGEAYISQHLALLRPEREINSFFISELLASDFGQRQFKSANKGGVKAGLNFNDIKAINILLPPLALQQRFAAIVEKIEAQKATAAAQAEASEALFQGLLQKAFGKH